MNAFVKKEFIRQMMESQSARWLKNQETLFISKRLQFHTGRLRDDRKIDIKQADHLDGQLSFTHPDYERFLEIPRKVKRKRGSGFRTKRGYNIHNRFIMGHYFSLARDLMFGLTNDVARVIKAELENK